MAARGGLSHLLGTLEDLRWPFASLRSWPYVFVEFWVDLFSKLNKVRAIYKPRKPPVEGEAKPTRKWAGPAGLPLFRARLSLIFHV